jgi:phosphate transport system substrate-binding protein
LEDEKMRSIKKMRIAASLFAILLSCAVILSGCHSKSDEKVSVVGSTSVEPLAKMLADEFEKEHSQKIDIQGVGSTAGIKAVNDGTCDIGTSSRELSDEEKTWNLKETVIAVDGITVIVNLNNKIENLSKDQIVKVFKGEIKNWKELGGQDKEIIIVSREAGSGTRGAFEELLKLQKKENDKTISLVAENALIADGNGAVMANIAGKDNAIGYMSIGMVDQTRVKKLKVDGVEATKKNVRDKKYTISRPFIMLTKGEPVEGAKEFIDFILSDAGQQVVSKDYISVK